MVRALSVSPIKDWADSEEHFARTSLSVSGLRVSCHTQLLAFPGTQLSCPVTPPGATIDLSEDIGLCSSPAADALGRSSSGLNRTLYSIRMISSPRKDEASDT
ncbi:unnamed protein product [Protopolystoma xenopodis]|uniref:Uncharacterized protein n=1 Tax=Protopolystoma xenopodis TaxID=117903 RepID=A0A448X345_9PLAT|nr:unnamed protein product [Protopolystoma xenopodis]